MCILLNVATYFVPVCYMCFFQLLFWQLMTCNVSYFWVGIPPPHQSVRNTDYIVIQHHFRTKHNLKFKNLCKLSINFSELPYTAKELYQEEALLCGRICVENNCHLIGYSCLYVNYCIMYNISQSGMRSTARFASSFHRA